MSAVAFHFNPAFAMGARSALTWSDPGSPNDSLLGADISSVASGTDPSLTPRSEAISLASSPPSGSTTPELHIMNRRKDKARRDSKIVSRAKRAGGSSQNTPPPSMVFGSHPPSGVSIPLYSPAQSVSILPEPGASLQSQLYMQPYHQSLEEASQNSQMFTSSPYQQSIPYPHSMSVNYSALYSGAAEYGYGGTRDSLPPYHRETLQDGRLNNSRISTLPLSQDSSFLYIPAQARAPVASAGSDQVGSHVRVVQSRPKPQCWEHGCNGRQFSTFSNLLRHQREKSGQAAKATCPNCGAEFTRTTARNGHLRHDKCKQRRSKGAANVNVSVDADTDAAGLFGPE